MAKSKIFRAVVVCVALAIIGLIVAEHMNQSPQEPIDTTAFPTDIIIATWHDSWGFDIDLQTHTPRKMWHVVKPADTRYTPQLVQVIRSMSKDRKSRLELARGLRLPVEPHQEVQALYAPDCSTLLEDLMDRDAGYRQTLTVMSDSKWIRTLELDDDGEQEIPVDYRFSTDSRTVYVLAYAGVYSKSPLGLLSAISGHPMPIETYYLYTFDLATGTKQKSTLLRQVDNGEGVFADTPHNCTPGKT